MKRIPAYSIGWIAKEYITKHRIFRIHSVFSRGAYVELNGDIVFDIAVSRIRSESSISLDMDYFLLHIKDLSKFISIGDRLVIDKNLILVDNSIAIDLAKASIYSPEIKTYREICYKIKSLEDIDKTLERFLNISIFIGKIYRDELEILSDILKHIHSIAIGRDHVEELVRLLEKCIGFGRGLTPSCDDLAAGFITTYNILGKICGGKPVEISESSLKKTTVISAYILRKASKGVIYEPLEKLLRDPNDPKMIGALIDLLEIGHSSGAMFGMGALIGMKLYSSRSTFGNR
ncbi:MAG: DUF2877 domain-containing protein [Sulfolobales archaeon]